MEVKFSHLVKYLSSVSLDLVDSHLKALLDSKIIKKRDYNDIIKRVLINRNAKLGL